MRLLVHLAKRDLIGMIVGYAPGKHGPLAIVLVDNKLVTAKLAEIEVMGLERNRKIRPTDSTQAEIASMDRLN